MQTYETIFITRPTLTEEEERVTVEGLAQIVTSGGGTFAANDRMGRRRLAYPILKQTDGVYVRFLYDADPAVPKELERRCRLSDDVLRAMTVRLDPIWAAAAKEKAVRDEEARIENERLEREKALEEERQAAEDAEAGAARSDDEDRVTVEPAVDAEDAWPAEAESRQATERTATPFDDDTDGTPRTED